MDLYTRKQGIILQDSNIQLSHLWYKDDLKFYPDTSFTWLCVEIRYTHWNEISDK